MKIGIYAPTAGVISGGAMVLYKYANMLVERGHEVQLAHSVFCHKPELRGAPFADWFDFDSRIVHHVDWNDSWATEPEQLGFGPWDVEAFIGPSALFPDTPNPIFLLAGSFFHAGDEELLRLRGPIACVSNHLMERCLAIGIDHDRLVYLPNGIDHDVFRPPPSESVRRTARVAIAANWWPTKNTAVAVKVLDKVKEQVPEMEVVAFGADDEAPWLPSWYTYHGGFNHPQLAEHVYQTSRLFLCTSADEGFGLPSLEAMACGAALVTTDTGGSRDFARHDDSGLVYEVDDTEGLARGVAMALTDDGLWNRLTASGIETAAGFCWDRSASLLESTLLHYVADPAKYGYG